MDNANVPGLWRSVRWAWRRGGEGGGISRARLVWRAFVASVVETKAMKRWMNVVYELSMRGLVTDAPGEYLRAVRPYVHRRTGFSARVVQLIEHIDWLETGFKPHALSLLAAGQPVVLAEMTPPRGYDFMRVQLQRSPVQSPEGEMLLVLQMQRSPEIEPNPVPLQVAALCFSRFRIDGTGCFVIGGVRGQRHPVRRASPVEIAQAMQGWQPPVFMVRVAQEMARGWGLRLVGLNPSWHRLQGWTYQWNARHRDTVKRIYDSYDALWDHFDATKGPDGWMVLPLESDDKLAATASSPEKRERQIRRADFWIRTRKSLLQGMRDHLERPHGEGRLRNTQSQTEAGAGEGWEDIESEVRVREPRRSTKVLETGPGELA